MQAQSDPILSKMKLMRIRSALGSVAAVVVLVGPLLESLGG